ncbi:MAG TPA: hypothetical protein VKS22_14280 [Candidatus Binataceae bacterium]|nr:hypothetical protein [Candidatus Binataceae bacterium]
MEERKLELTITEELYRELQRIAEAVGDDNLAGVATAGLAQWIGWRTAELDSRDPAQRYFVNEALDALLEGKK